MKNQLHYLYMVAKFSVYGMIIQCFLFTALIASEGKAQIKNIKEVPIALQSHHIRVKQALELIENETGFHFVYNNKEINNDVVEINDFSVTVAQILEDISKQARLSFKQVNNNISVKPIYDHKTESDVQVFVQERQVTGKVYASDTKEGLPGVNVIIKGTSVGTVTDFDGNYSINIDSDDAILIFSSVGYVSEEISVGDRSVIDVTLNADVTALEEIVVIGYGEQKKSLTTGAISSVKAEELQSIPQYRADQAIQGRTAGVSVLSTSGAPGAGTKIRIRGTNSNGNSNPLFIVDGMKTRDINSIDPADIESIEVLKDAASAAIYGTEGANGVIIITTRTGKGDEAKINYDFQYGLQSARSNVDLMNAQEYKQWMEESGAGTVTLDGTDTNWMDEVFETAPMQKHYLSYSSSTKKSTYMISGSYFTQDGIVGGDKAKYDRITARTNVKSDVKDWLEMGSNIGFMHSKRKYVGEDDEYRSVVNNTMLIDPLTPVTYSGTPANIQSLIDQGYTMLKDGSGRYYGLAKYVTGETTNPLALLQTYHNNITEDNLLGTAYATIKPFKGFSFTSRMGLDLTYQTQHVWNPEYYFSSENQNTMTTVDDDIHKYYTWLWENFASYHTAFNDHDITVLLGYSAQEYQAPDYSLHAGPLIAEGDQYAYQGSTGSREFDQVDGGFIDQTMTSMFGRLSYSYLSKYMLEFSLRRDAASVFPSNNRAAFFPAASAGWIISEEDFFNLSWMNQLKLRGSWGENGSKANLPGNEDREFWVFSGIRYPDATDTYQAGGEIDKLINTDLKWERTQQVDVGLDLGFLENKFTFSVDYYHKTTKDLIVQGTGPLSVGNEYPFVNGGDVVNKGFDFELGYRSNEGEFKYSVNVNLSTQDNEVSNLAVDAPVAGDNLRGYDLTWFEEGYPIWYFKGYKTDGIDKETGEPVIVDVNKDGSITAADQTYIGDPHADVLYGAIFNCEYKNFDLNLFLQGTQGNDVYMGWFRSDRPFSNKPKFMFEDRWTASNTDASWPKANNTSDYVYRSDLMVANGSYLRVKQIQLGYTIPETVLQHVGIDRTRLYVSLDDYFTLTKYKGLDPEAGSGTDNRQGVDRGIYPIAGKVMFGVSLNF